MHYCTLILKLLPDTCSLIGGWRWSAVPHALPVTSAPWAAKSRTPTDQRDPRTACRNTNTHTHTHTGRLCQVLNQVLLTHVNIFLTAAGLSRNCFMCYNVISLYRKKFRFWMGSDVKFFENIKVRVQRTTTVSSQHRTMDRSAGKSQTLPVLPFVLNVQKDTIS